MYFKSMDARVSVLFLAPMGFATGLLAATIAVGGFIGVPAMMYFLGLPALIASATELVIAFVMGLGGTFFYALDGYVDIRLAMIILGGSLFGIQIGAIGTTYVKDYVVKFVMAAIMLLVLVSRFFYIPGYLSELGSIATMDKGTRGLLDGAGLAALAFALIFGATMILLALYKGMRDHRLAQAAAPAAAPTAPAAAPSAQLSPVGRFERFLVASDGSEFSAAAVREALSMAGKCGAQVHVMSLVATGVEHEALGESILKQELAKAQAHLDGIAGPGRRRRGRLRDPPGPGQSDRPGDRGPGRARQCRRDRHGAARAARSGAPDAWSRHGSGDRSGPLQRPGGPAGGPCRGPAHPRRHRRVALRRCRGGHRREPCAGLRDTDHRHFGAQAELWPGAPG